MAEVLNHPQTATAAETAKQETPATTDGFHLVIDALKLNDLEHDLRAGRHSHHGPGAPRASRRHALHRLSS